MATYWLTLGLAAALGALIGAVVSVWTVARTIKQKSVIEERQKWRDTLRELVPDLIATENPTERVRIRNTVVLKLNPHDEADVRAVESIDEFISDPSERGGGAIVAMFQKMLKLDWERAKIEASLRPWNAARRATKRVSRQEEDRAQSEMVRMNEQQTDSVQE